MGRRVLDVVVTVRAVAASVVSSFYVFGADGYSPVDRELHPSVLSSLAFLAALIALAALAAARRDRVLWAGGALVCLATALALWRDMGWHDEMTITATSPVASS